MKKMFHIILMSSVLLSIGGTVVADDGVMLELIVRQKPAGIDKHFEIARDTVEIVVGGDKFLTLVNMNVDIGVTAADSQYVDFVIHMTTIGKNIHNDSRRFRIEYNLPGRIENIPGKNGSSYQLLISPRNQLTIDPEICPLSIRDDYKIDPSANFDISCVENSLADYQWSNLKNYLEYDYTLFKNAFDLNIPGKIDFYFCPCPDLSIRWDSRFGYMIDPGRANIYALHNHAFSSIDAILPNMLTILRTWGYAPPFLVEGIAGYFNFSNYDMKELPASKQTIPINELLTLRQYYGADPEVAEIEAASFCKYLLDSYGRAKLINVYENADDLTILSYLELEYERSLDSLEKEWRHYVDTLQFSRKEFDLNAARASALYRFEDQVKYNEQMLEYDANRYDSIDTRSKLSALYYQVGEYYRAEESYRELVRIDGQKTAYMHILGNLAMVNGEYDKAAAIFDTVTFLDKTMITPRLLQARILLTKGDTSAALKMAEKYYPEETNEVGKIEFLLFLGDIHNSPGQFFDTATASGYYSDALIWSRDLIPQAPLEPTLKMRAGMALLGLKQLEQARQFLEVAYFTEVRTFYLCKTMIALGKVYDLKGERETALEYYSRALQIPITDYDRIECLQLMDKPFSR